MIDLCDPPNTTRPCLRPSSSAGVAFVTFVSPKTRKSAAELGDRLAAARSETRERAGALDHRIADGLVQLSGALATLGQSLERHEERSTRAIDEAGAAVSEAESRLTAALGRAFDSGRTRLDQTGQNLEARIAEVAQSSQSQLSEAADALHSQLAETAEATRARISDEDGRRRAVLRTYQVRVDQDTGEYLINPSHVYVEEDGGPAFDNILYRQGR
jgi:hypothetical protein